MDGTAEVDDIVVTGQAGVVPEAAVVAAAATEPAAEEVDDDRAAAEPAAGAADADGADGGSDDTTVTTEAARTLAKSKGSLQKRIDQFKKGEAEARRQADAEKVRADAAEARARELEAKLAGSTPPAGSPAPPAAAVAPPADDPEPDLAAYDGEDGKTYEKWVADMAKWSARQAVREADTKRTADDRARVEREASDRAHQDVVAKHSARLETFRSAHPDFDTILDASEAVTTPLITDFITRSDVGPAVALHLAQHPELSVQIAEMPVGQALVALGRLEGRLLPTEAASPTGSAPRIPVTRAPLPGRPVGARAIAHVSDDDLDTDDFIERRNEEERQRRGR